MTESITGYISSIEGKGVPRPQGEPGTGVMWIGIDLKIQLDHSTYSGENEAMWRHYDHLHIIDSKAEKLIADIVELVGEHRLSCTCYLKLTVGGTFEKDNCPHTPCLIFSCDSIEQLTVEYDPTAQCDCEDADDGEEDYFNFYRCNPVMKVVRFSRSFLSRWTSYREPGTPLPKQHISWLPLEWIAAERRGKDYPEIVFKTVEDNDRQKIIVGQLL